MRKPIVPQRIELDYARKLRKVATVVGLIIEHHTIIERNSKGDIVKLIIASGLQMALRNYATSLSPWAMAIANIMLKNVLKANDKFLLATSVKIAESLKEERNVNAIGAVANKLQSDQVTLITSLPIEAGERVQKIAQEFSTSGKRYDELADMIASSGDVTKSRANTIARTEVHKAYATMTQSRAQYVGANQYIWRTAGDEIVRESHAEMDGAICDYNNPPTLSDGETCNAGETYNCRCYAEPIIGD